jgi:hypothetical protein
MNPELEKQVKQALTDRIVEPAAKPTPRPWRNGEYDKITDDKGETITLQGFALSMGRNDEAAANAALIVRAVNSFDALVAACEAVAAHIDPEAPIPNTSKRDAMLKLRAALALARGEK